MDKPTLAEARKQHGFSVSDLARRAGVAAERHPTGCGDCDQSDRSKNRDENAPHPKLAARRQAGSFDFLLVGRPPGVDLQPRGVDTSGLVAANGKPQLLLPSDHSPDTTLQISSDFFPGIQPVAGCDQATFRIGSGAARRNTTPPGLVIVNQA